MATPRWCGASVCAAISSVLTGCARLHMLKRDARGPPPQERGRKRVAIPAQIGRKPFDDAEPAFAVPALEPSHRHLGDRPVEPMRLHQELDAVAVALIRLD